MRANTRFELGVQTAAILFAGPLSACADDDPYTDPNTPDHRRRTR
jgi:hypothetical protein